MNARATLKWAGLALLGIVVAVAVAVAASHLASQRIGLASEPIRAGEALSPPPPPHPARQRPQRHRPLAAPSEPIGEAEGEGEGADD